MPEDDTNAWLPDLAAAVAAGDPARALALLEARATAHAGTPNAADKRAAVKAIAAAFAGRSDDLGRWARWLAAQPGPAAKELAALLLARTYPLHAGEAQETLRRLADDANWEVREWAGSAAGEVLARHFDGFYPVLQRWAADPSQFVRRAVCIAAIGAAGRRRPQRCLPLLDLLEPLAADRAEEVRRNLGPFAVGGALMRAYPEETLARVRRWAASDDEMRRWNAAMVFAAAPAGKHVEAALEILSELARDQRRLVWMAVSSALRNLVRRDPGRVAPALRAWLNDDRKLPAALALRRAGSLRSP